MILYRGELFDNSKQAELIDRLKDDLLTPIRDGVVFEREKLIEACDILAAKVLGGAFKEVVRPLMEELNISEKEFKNMVDLFRKESLEYKCSIELSDEEKTIDGKIRRRRVPLGVLMHIAAGNVDALPAYSVIEGLLAGNINILKLPMGDSGISVRLLNELVTLEPTLKDFIYVFDVPSTETETLKRLADLSDAVVVWGGDAAVRAARDMTSVNTKVIAWGHKLSFAYAESDCTDLELYDLAKSICVTNQLLCSSCQGIFVDTDSREEQEALARRFFDAMKMASAETNPVSYGMRAKNAINLYNEKLEKHVTGNEVLKGEGFSVIVTDDPELKLSYMYRNVWVKRLPFSDIITLKEKKNYLQTASVLTANRPMRTKIENKLAAVGVTRLTTAGHMSRTVSGEAHDGTYALREYSRIVETEVF